MNKTSQLQNQTLSRIILIFTLCVLISLMSVQTAKADVAPPPDPRLGGAVPYQPLKTNVQMMSETVFIEILPSPPADAEKPKQVRVNASFTMRNQGQAEEQMQVIFPLSSLENPYADPAQYQMDSSSFVAKVDGKIVPITEITTPAEVSAFIDKENSQSGYFHVKWAAFDVTFPVQQDVLLEVQYDMFDWYQMSGFQTFGLDGIAYILETGAGWYGNILSADIILHFPYPASDEVISYANPGYVFSGNEMRWEYRDFEPTRDDNLEVGLFRVDVWQTILKLRARVKQNPKDADAWIELGNMYIDYAIFRKESLISVKNPHFVELAVEARQNVVDLQPDSGIAHFKLAESLWFNIPNTRQEDIPTDLRLDDPAVQQVFHELKQAWAYGVDIDSYFTYDLVRTFPGLKLDPPLITTITIAPPTQTSAPTATDTSMPTDSPTPKPTFTQTPLPTQTETSSSFPSGVLIATIFGLAVITGIFAYRLKLKGE